MKVLVYDLQRSCIVIALAANVRLATGKRDVMVV
jgi:hypothetical protein